MATTKNSQKVVKDNFLKSLRAKAQKTKTSGHLLTAEDKKDIKAIEALSPKKCKIVYKDDFYTMALVSTSSPAVRGQQANLSKDVVLYELPPVDYSDITVAVKATWR